MYTAIQETVWPERFLRSLGVILRDTDPIGIHCDSMGTLAYVNDLKYHENLSI